MREFPSHFIPTNKEKFHVYIYKRNLAYMRKEIFELVLQGNENNYFDLENFRRVHKIKNSDIINMVDVIKDELQKLGWKVKTSFGETGLFVFSTETPPSSCYDDNF